MQVVDEYKLYNTAVIQTIAHRLLRDFVNSLVSEYGISVAAWTILDLLLDKKVLNFNEMAVILGVDAPFITELTNELIDKRLIEVTRSEEDKRVKEASLTIDGLRLGKKMSTRITRKLFMFLEGCTQAELETYFKVLQTIIVNARKAGY